MNPIPSMEGILMTVEGRPSRHQVLMANAHAFSLLSTCSRQGNGALITREGRILSTGYNGAPAGMPHCDHTCTCHISAAAPLDDEHYLHCPADTSGCQTAVHAEANAIAFAAKHGVSTNGTTIYCTTMPCVGCARLIINSGIERVLYLHSYRLDDGVRLLMAAPSVKEVKQL